jgi:hypothetical protein
MPTVADALGVDLATTPHFGRSVFAEGSTIMPAGGFMAVGTYVDDEVLYVPSSTFEAGSAYDMANGRNVGVAHAENVKWERMRQLQLLCGAYVRKLPGRQDYDPTVGYELPE